MLLAKFRHLHALLERQRLILLGPSTCYIAFDAMAEPSPTNTELDPTAQLPQPTYPPVPLPPSASYSPARTICLGALPNDFERDGTPEGRNAARLAQARQDHPTTLDDFDEPRPQAPHRPEDLYTILPQPKRTLFGQDMYHLNMNSKAATSGTKRIATWVIVAQDAKTLSSTMAQTSRWVINRSRMIFRLPLQEDVTISRLMAHIITNICERLPFDFAALTAIDKSLTQFIVDTASIHAGIANHVLPPTHIIVPSALESANAQTVVRSTVPVVYKSSLTNPIATSFVHQKTIQIPLSWIPDRPAPKVPPMFSVPAMPALPRSGVSNSQRTTRRRAVDTLQWVQSHVATRVFEDDAACDEYIEFLVRLICLQPTEDHDEKKLFDLMHLPGQLYLIYPTTPADVGQVLTEIEVPDKFTRVLRTIMRLETVYLATGSFEQGWQAACKRADIELEMSPDDDDECYSCNCTLPERPNTVHRRDECGKQERAELKRQAEQEKTKSKQQIEQEKKESKQVTEQNRSKRATDRQRKRRAKLKQARQDAEARQEKPEPKQEAERQKKNKREAERRAEGQDTEVHPAGRFWSMILKDLHKRQRPVEPTEEYKSQFTITRETQFMAFQAKWASADGHFRDAYRGQEAPKFDKAGIELRVKNWPGTAERAASCARR